MKNRFIALALLLAFAICALPAHASAEVGETAEYVLAPAVSEGVEVMEHTPGSMSVLAHTEGSDLVFDETKLISFIASYGGGWLACTRYSHFFPDDARAGTEALENGDTLFMFRAEQGSSVSLGEWNSVAVNASCSELPKLYIDAAEDFADIDRETWVDATFTLTLGTKHFESGDYSGSGSVKGRGNSSWTQPKKPYSIKLSSKASLLDIPKTKKYAVIPSYADPTLMRNYITYKSWQALVGIGYVPKCEFVDVYLNGSYNGVYLLVERIDIEKSKIDIEEADANDLTGGYLIEKDLYGRIDMEEDLWFDCPYWANQVRDYFVLKAPEPDDPELAAAMRSYLTDYMQRLHDTVMGTGGNYLEYVDTSSWIDFIIVQELAKNIDGNMKTSCWMYKRSGDDKLYMTAPWDFDLAYGRVSWNNQSEQHNDVVDCPNANTYDGFMIVNSSNPWMDRLYDDMPGFRAALMMRYADYRHTVIDGMFSMIDEQAAYLMTVQQANAALWSDYSFHSGIRIMKVWLAGRADWLDGQWLVDGRYKLGDVDMNGEVNALDALTVLRSAMHIITLDDTASAIADVDGDGEVTANDALLLMRITMGLV